MARLELHETPRPILLQLGFIAAVYESRYSFGNGGCAMEEYVDRSRRSMLLLAPAAGVVLALPEVLLAQKQQGQEQEEVTPTEDLMREHGLLKRILLIYDEIRNRIVAQTGASGIPAKIACPLPSCPTHT
jgi:hypothetical protein